MKKAIILTWDGVQDQELIYPYYRLQEAGFEVRIFANASGHQVTGLFGIKFQSQPLDTLQVEEIIDYHKRDYDTDWSKYVKESTILVLPGGVKSLEKLRQQKVALDLVKYFNDKNEIIASTCHGAQMLISARVVKDKQISGYYSIKDDIENAGAKYVDAPSVVAGNIISSPHYKDMPSWMKSTLDQWSMTRVKPDMHESQK